MVKETELTPQLSIDSFEFSYDDKKILNGISLQIKKGEVLAIVGESGSGKSTLLKCISALLEVNKGNAFLNGQQIIQEGELIFEPWELRQRIVIVFQDYNLFPNMTVLENIKIALEKVKNIGKEEANKIAVSMCEKLKISELKNKYPNEISGGQAQRVALARALVLQPQILLLDEVTSAIDPSTILNVIGVINEIKNAEETKDTSIILVTHNIRFAVDYSDNIAFLHEGKIHEQLPAKQFLTESKSPVTLQYIKDSKYFT
jgi:polar amino acid transport system ATP-binding protein